MKFAKKRDFEQRRGCSKSPIISPKKLDWINFLWNSQRRPRSRWAPEFEEKPEFGQPRGSPHLSQKELPEDLRLLEFCTEKIPYESLMNALINRYGPDAALCPSKFLCPVDSLLSIVTCAILPLHLIVKPSRASSKHPCFLATENEDHIHYFIHM